MHLGTYGEFRIGIDATGTETFLEYEIDIGFKNKPTNLKFYYNSDRTQEIQVSNDKITSKGFISYKGIQIRNETIYWEWPIETGTTQEEINANDIIDSTFMKSVMEMDIKAVGRQVKEPTIDMYTKDCIVARYEGKYNTNNGHENATSTWYDISGNGRNGIINNATFGENYLNFNGVSSWVNLGEMNYENITLETTFIADAYAGYDGGERHIIDNCEAGGYSLHIYENKLRAEIYIEGIGWYQSDEMDFQLGKLYNFALTYDRKKFCIYLNGNKEQEIDLEGIIGKPLRDTVMVLGVNPSGEEPKNGGFFYGKIYSAAVYNKALTEAEIIKNAEVALTFASSEQ